MIQKRGQHPKHGKEGKCFVDSETIMFSESEERVQGKRRAGTEKKAALRVPAGKVCSACAK